MIGFSEIPGLAPLKNTLIQAVKNNHIAHAQLFMGKPGGAATSIALSYAKYLNCENPTDEDACNECASCHKLNKLAHPDFHFIFPYANRDEKSGGKASLVSDFKNFLLTHPFGTDRDWADFQEAGDKQFNIPAADSREIISITGLKAFEGKYKIVLIWMPEYLNATSANALLKVLEEPFPQTIFLIVSLNVENVLPTILSRCQIIQVPNFEDEDVRNYLIDKSQLSEEEAQKVTFLVEGNLSEAGKIVHDVQDNDIQLFRKWMLNCYEQNFFELINLSEEFNNLSKEAQKNFLSFSLNIFRDVLIINFGSENMLRLNESDYAFLSKFSKVFTVKNAEPIIRFINEAHYQVSRNVNSKILFLDTSIQIATFIKKK